MMYTFNDTVNKVMDPLNDPNIRPIILLFLAVYGGLAAPSLSPEIRSKFDNIGFRVIMLAFLVWIASRDPGVAVAAATVFIVVMNLAGGKGAFERFEGPSTAIYPGCMNIKVYDLLESFKNDKEALMSAMLVSRVPGDIKITDYYAPLIATYLLNKGFVLKSPCVPPGVDQKSDSWL